MPEEIDGNEGTLNLGCPASLLLPLRKLECLKTSRPDFFSPNKMRVTEIRVDWTWPILGTECFQDFLPLGGTWFSLGLLGAFTLVYTCGPSPIGSCDLGKEMEIRITFRRVS